MATLHIGINTSIHPMTIDLLNYYILSLIWYQVPCNVVYLLLWMFYSFDYFHFVLFLLLACLLALKIHMHPPWNFRVWCHDKRWSCHEGIIELRLCLLYRIGCLRLRVGLFFAWFRRDFSLRYIQRYSRDLDLFGMFYLTLRWMGMILFTIFSSTSSQIFEPHTHPTMIYWMISLHINYLINL